MLSSPAIRTLVALVTLAMLAGLAGGAQCVVRCASPAARPPCHHHAPSKQNAPAQVCASEMLPVYKASPAAPVIVITAQAAAPAVETTAPAEVPASSAAPQRLVYSILRI